jgi:hypothetical protein
MSSLGIHHNILHIERARAMTEDQIWIISHRVVPATAPVMSAMALKRKQLLATPRQAIAA